MGDTTRVGGARGRGWSLVLRLGLALGLLAAVAPAARAGSVTLKPSAEGGYLNQPAFGPPSVVFGFPVAVTFSTSGVTENEVIYSLGFIPQGTSITSAQLLIDVYGTQQNSSS